MAKDLIKSNDDESGDDDGNFSVANMGRMTMTISAKAAANMGLSNKCKHVMDDECGCRCHDVDIRAHGCCNPCDDCGRLIPKSLTTSKRVMAVVVATSVDRARRVMVAGRDVDEGTRLITPKQESMVWAKATEAGVQHMLLEWLEYESGLRIQVKAVSEIRFDQVDAVLLALALDKDGGE